MLEVKITNQVNTFHPHTHIQNTLINPMFVFKGRIVVAPGDYQYTFDCNIPDECPTSVEDDTGFIRYSITVFIDEDDDRKKEFVESFTVLKPLDLNDDESNSVRND